MFYPQKIVLENFLSHEKSEYVFTADVATMIYGVNECDKDDQVSNGSGKSAITEAIAVAYTGKPLRKDTSAKEFVRDGQKQAFLSFYLKDHDEKELLIKWNIFANTKAATLEIWFDQIPIHKANEGVDEGKKKIVDIVGISREDFLNFFVISKDRYKTFLNASDTAKKETISRFSQADRVDVLFDQIDIEIDSLVDEEQQYERDVLRIDTKIEMKQGELERKQSSLSLLEDKKREWEEDQEKIIERHRSKIVNANERITYYQDRINQDKKVDKIKKEECLQYEKEISELSKLQKDNDLKEKEYREELDQIKVEISKYEEVLIKINHSINDSVECPKCEHEFSVADPNINIIAAKKNQKAVIDTIESLKLDKREIQDDIFKAESVKGGIRSNKFITQGKLDGNLASIKQAESDLNTNLRYIEEFRQQKPKYEALIKQVEGEEYIDPAIEKKEELKVIKEEIVQFKQDKIEIEKKKDLSESKLVQTRETKELVVQFKTHLSNRAIGAIEAYANHYLTKTKTNLSVQIDGYKLTKKKEIREKISAIILKNGLEYSSFGRLSSGERVRIELAIIHALKELINNNCQQGKGLDLLFLDEIIESVDSKGISNVLKALNSLEQTIAIITHGTFNANYSHVISVRKDTKGISSIK